MASSNNSNNNNNNNIPGGQFEDATYNKVSVVGLARETQRETVKKHFEHFGDVLQAVVITDKTTGTSKGYGFVTFRKPDSAMRACADAAPVIDGRRINCKLASLGVQISKPSTHKHNGGGGGGGGGEGGMGTAFSSATTFPHYAVQQGIHRAISVEEMAHTPPTIVMETPVADEQGHGPLADAVSSPVQLCRHFTFAEIQSATRNFENALILGKGGFGKVYKGFIDSGATTVAIKRLDPMSNQGDTKFRTEIEMLSKFRHCNLVSLIGYCYDGHEMIIVYEYMCNGSMADHLHPKENTRNGNSSILSWVRRLKICIGAARGIDYLHTGMGILQRVIHRDVKSSNILLDENWAAKVSDFGLCKIGPANQSCTHVSTHVKGTPGYCDPDYFLTRRVTKKSDVYSFGVVLFEVLTGKPALDLRLPREQRSLVAWAQHCIQENTPHKLIDPNLKWEIRSESLEAFVGIAAQCVQIDSKKRPKMTEVVLSLELALTMQTSKDSSLLNEYIFDFGEIYDDVDDHSLQLSSKTHKAVVKGEKEDPVKILQTESHRQVELLSPILKPPAEESKPKEKETLKPKEKKPPADEPKPKEKETLKPEEKKEEPQIITVVLKLYMHCEACAQEIKKLILKYKGVENADPDFESLQVTVRGVFDPPRLVRHLYKRTRKHAVIVKQDPLNIKEDDKGKEEKKAEESAAVKEEKNGGEEGGKAEEKKEGGRGSEETPVKLEAAADQEREEGGKEEEKKEGGRGGEETPVKPEAAADQEGKEGGKEEEKKEGGRGGKETPVKPEAAADQEETKADMKNELQHIYQPTYQSYPQTAQNYQVYPQAAQILGLFSDENPNACSVM